VIPFSKTAKLMLLNLLSLLVPKVKTWYEIEITVTLKTRLLITAQGEGLPSTLSISGQRSSRLVAQAQVGVIETREELQNEGDDARERVVENPEHENRDEGRPEPIEVPSFIVNPDGVHADLEEEDNIVDDFRRLGLFVRVVRILLPLSELCTD
jgi:hypothetical protein